MKASTRTVCSVVFLLALGSLTASARAPEVTIDLAARAMTPGELVVVTLTFATEPSSVQVGMFNHTTRAFDTGAGTWKALVGIDLDQRPGAYSLSVDARVGSATIHHAHSFAVARKTFPTRTLDVSPDFVNPPASLAARIAREAELVRDAYVHSAPERLWQAPFTRPVPQAANSRFGQRSVFNGQERNRHSGTDFASPEGTPIHAPNTGRVVVADNLFFSGNTVILDHGLGVFSILAHLSRIDVHAGDMAPVGSVIGLVGATGRVTGAHLHWALRVSGARVDSMGALALLGGPATSP